VTADAGLQRREVYYSGRVQGVGFRFTAQGLASRYALAGYVKNLRDGRVELVVEGPAEELDQFLAALQARLGGHIGQVRQQTLESRGEFHQFEIRF
jgi:acylphosphatase